MLQNAQPVVGCHRADFDRVESPLFEDAEDFLLRGPFRATSSMRSWRFAEHDFVRSHAGLALRYAVEFDFNADAAARAHFAGGARQPGGAHVLNADNRAGLHRFEAGFEQQLFHETDRRPAHWAASLPKLR